MNDARELEIDLGVPNPDIAAFGFGRRICPGRFVAYESMWMAIATMLATLDITKCRDENGIEITPQEEYSTGFMT